MAYILLGLVVCLVGQVAEGVRTNTAQIAQGIQMEKADSPSDTNTSTTQVYAFDRDHPLNVSVEDISYKYMNVTWMAPDNTTDLLYYLIHYIRIKQMPNEKKCPHESMSSLNVSTAPNKTFYHGSLKGLDAGTKYFICVEAVYSSGHQPYTHVLERQTLGCGPFSAERRCDCSPYGTDPANRCIGDTCTCQCKNKFFTGDKCDQCVKGYYVHTAIQGGKCEPCNCPADRSKGTCAEVDKLVRCDCKDKYYGPTCKMCADGLYQTSSGVCSPCKCNGNQHPDDNQVCDRTTGVCASCYYNTTGDYCDKCKEGYIGNALNRTCKRDESKPLALDDDDNNPNTRSKHYQRLHMATIAGVVVGVIGLVVMLVTICFVIRWKKLGRRRPLQLWTIQLRSGDERLNFSQLVDTAGDEDMDGGGRQLFEKDHQPTAPTHRNSKSNIYRAVRT